MLIHHQAAVGALVFDPAQGDAGEGTAVAAFKHQLQVGYGQVHADLIAVIAVGIADFLAAGDVAAVAVLVGPAHFEGAVGPQWQRQVNDLVDRAAVGDFQRGGRRQVVGNIEDTAVGHDPACLGNGDFTEAQVLGVQRQFAEAVEGVVEAVQALMHGGFGGAGLLLEVLGLDEQTFMPDDGVA